ncbi:ABC-2 type transporter [Popillia japonica]|uniref:ABC-2 type transporter n=1 Tax=Popillia japonica TaxID=7064 RepID=A0AAW1IZ45_POPJA
MMEIDKKTEGIIRNIKRPLIDIEFYDLCCNIGKKNILKSISGNFRSGSLTGILGSSGAGKTTLLNVLAGDNRSNVSSGSIHINGRPRIMSEFRKTACYIRQDDLIQPFLTVLESITIVAELKLGQNFSAAEKECLSSGILSLIGLGTSLDTRVEHLSGGQRKRLIIALELVNNPAILFLDEPTTGLDDVSVRNCIQLLKCLTLQGRTIICTLHQPSHSLLKLFDTVYFMSNGYCIYNGTAANLISFLSSAKFTCPKSYNPADYIIEIVHDQQSNVLELKSLIDNGRNQAYLQNSEVNEEDSGSLLGLKSSNMSSTLSTSFKTQFSALLRRNFLQLKRNKIALALHFGHNIICGIGVGLLFYQIGTKASLALLNLKFCVGVAIYFLYTHMMAPILLYPSEVKLLEREYFNQWYNLKSYFVAYTVTLLPVIITTSLIFVLFTYFLTGQPLELYRFTGFALISILTAITSQGFGYTIGTLFNPTRGACVGSAASIPLVLLGIHGVGYGDSLEAFIEFLMSTSYPRHAITGLATAIYKDRGRFQCDDEFCIFGDSEFLLMKLGMGKHRFTTEAVILFAFFVFYRILSYIFLKIRVSTSCKLIHTGKLFKL